MRPPSIGIIFVQVAIQHARDSFRTTPEDLKRLYGGPIPRWGGTSPPAIALKKATEDDRWGLWEKNIVWKASPRETILFPLPEELKKYIEGAPIIPFSFSFNPMITIGRIL